MDHPAREPGELSPTWGGAAGKGPSLYAVLIVLAIIAVAAVAIQAARQRGGLPWEEVGVTPGGAIPRCTWPTDVAYVQGRVSVRPLAGAPDPLAGGPSCYELEAGAAGEPAKAADVAALLADDAAAIATACPTAGGLWYQGSGSYHCRPGRPSGWWGIGRRDRFYFTSPHADWAWDGGADREN